MTLKSFSVPTKWFDLSTVRRLEKKLSYVYLQVQGNST